MFQIFIIIIIIIITRTQKGRSIKWETVPVMDLADIWNVTICASVVDPNFVLELTYLHCYRSIKLHRVTSWKFVSLALMPARISILL
jgi:hypothetical protein